MIDFEKTSSLDPIPGPPIQFTASGRRIFLGNSRTRLAAEISENDKGEVEVREFEWQVIRDKAA